ncbi:MAG: ACP S-malonyltransferase [Phycisphaerae bacterium]
MGKTAIVFPGQGAQLVGMGHDVAARFASARRTFDQAADLLKFDLAKVCFSGPATELDQTDVAQPALFVTSVAIWRALEECGLASDLAPAAAAGLSLGEYTALWLAGSLSFEAGVTLVRERGRLMQAAADAKPGSMVSVMGLAPPQVEDVCRAAAVGEVLAPANFNAPGQIVISGDKGACDRSLAAIEQAGGRGVALRVAGAFHSPLMQPAADGLRRELASTTIIAPRIPVVSNVSADYHRDPASIRESLVTQVARPIQWQGSIERLVADGFDRFVEVGAGRVLSGLIRKISRGVQTVNYSSADAIAPAGAAI